MLFALCSVWKKDKELEGTKISKDIAIIAFLCSRSDMQLRIFSVTNRATIALTCLLLQQTLGSLDSKPLLENSYVGVLIVVSIATYDTECVRRTRTTMIGRSQDFDESIMP